MANADDDETVTPIKNEEPPETNGVKKEEPDVEDEEMIEDEEEDQSSSKESAKIITHTDSKLLYHEPAFAEVCSFFNTFGTSLGARYSIDRLEKVFCTLVNGKG